MKVTRTTVILWSVCICLGVSASAVLAQAPQPHMEIVDDEIIGVALYPDGITPIQDLPVRVWSVDRKKMIYKTRTDDEGVFQIPKIGEGRCYVFIGRVKVDLSVLSADQTALFQHHDIVAVVPRGMMLNARPMLMDVILAPLLLPKPKKPKVVSP